MTGWNDNLCSARPFRSDGTGYPVLVPAAGGIGDVGVTGSAFAGREIFPRALFKRAFDTGRTAGQITVIPAGLAAFVIFDAVLTKVARIGRPEFLTDIFVSRLAVAGGIDGFADARTGLTDPDKVLGSVTGFVIRGAFAFGIMRAGSIDAFVGKLLGSGTIGGSIRIKGRVAVTFVFAAAGSRTDSVGIRTFALGVFIVVVAATLIIVIVIGAGPDSILIRRTGANIKSDRFTVIDCIPKTHRMFVIFKTNFIIEIDN